MAPEDVAVRGSSEGGEDCDGPAMDFPDDALSYDINELPVATLAHDWSFADGLSLDDEGIPVLPDDFDRSRLPGQPER